MGVAVGHRETPDTDGPMAAEATTLKLDATLDRLASIREAGLWPYGLRDLWADALGVITLLNLHADSGEEGYLREAAWVALEVDRVLGRRRGIRIAQGPDGEGQSFRALAIWIWALHRLGEILPEFQARALALVREIHAPFVRPRTGIASRMTEDLISPYPGSGPGKLEAFLGLAIYREVEPDALAPEIEELQGMVQEAARSLAPDNGMDMGLLLWISHFSPGDPLSIMLRERALAALDERWVDPPGYFRRSLSAPWHRPAHSDPLAITNFSAAVGLQAQRVWTRRIHRIHAYFRSGCGWEGAPRDALASLFHCTALYPGLLLKD